MVELEMVEPWERPESSSMDFDTFYREEWAPITALAHGLCGSRPTAEELSQDAFIAAYRHWGRVSQLERPGGWVRRVVINNSMSALRRRGAEARARVRLRSLRAPAVEGPTLSEDREAFWGAVRDLPTRQAQAVALRYLEDRPIAEIAEILDCAENTVRVHLHRGRIALADRFTPEEGLRHD